MAKFRRFQPGRADPRETNPGLCRGERGYFSKGGGGLTGRKIQSSTIREGARESWGAGAGSLSCELRSRHGATRHQQHTAAGLGAHRANASGSQRGSSWVLSTRSSHGHRSTRSHGIQAQRLPSRWAQVGCVQTHGGSDRRDRGGLHPRVQRSLQGTELAHRLGFLKSPGPCSGDVALRCERPPGHCLGDCGAERLSVAHPCGHFFLLRTSRMSDVDTRGTETTRKWKSRGSGPQRPTGLI